MNSDFCVAVHALVYLNHKASVLSSEELAENICTNPARVRKVTAKLKKAGLLHTKEGSEGGCRFDLDPASVSLAQVAYALSVRFVETAWHSGDRDMACLVASGMANLMDGIFEDLNARCLARLAELSLADLDRNLFCPVDAGPTRKGEAT